MPASDGFLGLTLFKVGSSQLQMALDHRGIQSKRALVAEDGLLIAVLLKERLPPELFEPRLIEKRKLRKGFLHPGDYSSCPFPFILADVVRDECLAGAVIKIRLCLDLLKLLLGLLTVTVHPEEVTEQGPREGTVSYEILQLGGALHR